MKDATGELSMTAVAVVAIALISTLFLTIIWPQIKNNIVRNTYCSNKFNCGTAVNGEATCNYYDNNGNIGTIKCPVSDQGVNVGNN